MTYNFLPFMILPLYATLERFDKTHAGGGVRPVREPHEGVPAGHAAASMPGIVAGCLLTFIPAVGDFVNAQLLGSSRQFMIGNVIQSVTWCCLTIRPRRRCRSS